MLARVEMAGNAWFCAFLRQQSPTSGRMGTRRAPSALVRRGAGRQAALPAAGGTSGTASAGARRLTHERAHASGVGSSCRHARSARSGLSDGGCAHALTTVDRTRASGAMRLSTRRSGMSGICSRPPPGRALRCVGGEPCAEDDQRPADPRRRPDHQNARANDRCRERVPGRPGKDRMVAPKATGCPLLWHGLMVGQTEAGDHSPRGAFTRRRGPTRDRPPIAARVPRTGRPRSRMATPFPVAPGRDTDAAQPVGHGRPRAG
jgi:hypothetical protein